MFTNVKEFCIKTGFPERTLKRYIKEGKIPFHKAGRVYIIDYDKTLECLETEAQLSMQNTGRSGRRRKKIPSASGSFDEDIAYLKQLK